MSKRNRNPVKQVFITFPKSKIDKIQFRDDILGLSPQYYKVAEEKHQDGTPHLHAVVKLQKPYSVSYILKYFKEKYPDDYKRIDIDPVRSITNSIAYISKEDQNPLESGEFKESRNPQLNCYRKFARECGYDNIADLQCAIKLEEETYQKQESQLLQVLYDYESLGYNVAEAEAQMPYEIFSIYKNFLEKRILKDDMTKLLKYFQIQEELK